MITINDVEVLTVGDNVSWNGSRDGVTRTFAFSLLYVPQDDNFPVYAVKCGDKVVWSEDDTVLFYGYVTQIDYSTDDLQINISCEDLMARLIKSKAVGRFKGTLAEIANNICGRFGLQSGLNNDSTIVHNIVSEGDLTYYDVLNTACKGSYDRYTLIIDQTTVKVVDTSNVVNTFEIGRNIRTSSFSQDISDICNSVLIIDTEGKQLQTVQDEESISTYGLFQTVYNYNKDCKDNAGEAQKLFKTVQNKATLLLDNDNNCISGSYIKVIEPINNFTGIFEIQTDSHTIGADSSMAVDIEFIRAAEEEAGNE